MKQRYWKTAQRTIESRSRRGQTLIGLLVVVVIVIGLSMTFLGSRRGKDGTLQPSVAKQSIERAKVVGVGGNNLRQIGMCIDMYKGDNNGRVPPDLPSLKAACKEIPAPMWVNPTDGRPYQYDPSTGRVYDANEAPVGAAPGAPAAVAPAPGAPAAAPAAPAPAPLPGNRGPGGVRLPDMQPQAPVDAEQ